MTPTFLCDKFDAENKVPVKPNLKQLLEQRKNSFRVKKLSSKEFQEKTRPKKVDKDNFIRTRNYTIRKAEESEYVIKNKDSEVENVKNIEAALNLFNKVNRVNTNPDFCKLKYSN